MKKMESRLKRRIMRKTRRRIEGQIFILWGSRIVSHQFRKLRFSKTSLLKKKR